MWAKAAVATTVDSRRQYKKGQLQGRAIGFITVDLCGDVQEKNGHWMAVDVGISLLQLAIHSDLAHGVV